MNFVIDIILLLILGISIFRCYKDGFIKSLFSFCKFAVSLILAFALASTVGAAISENIVYDPTYEMVHSKVESVADGLGEKAEASELLAKLPDSLTNMIEEEGENKLITDEVISDIAENIAKPLSTVISNVAAFIIIFIASMLLLWLAMIILDKFFTLPILHQFNKLFGIILGSVSGVIKVVVACAVITGVLNLLCVNSPELSPEVMNEKTIIYGFVNSIGLGDLLFGLFI